MVELELPFRDVTYWVWYLLQKKRSRVWNNLGEAWRPKPICCKALPCEHFENGVHLATAQRGPCYKKGLKVPEGCHRQSQLYHIPEALCDEIALAAENIQGENAGLECQACTKHETYV